jgi:tetratricopeptide (TPR) repeat protein
MLGFAWLALRQAQEALKNGRLEEAYRLLCQPAAHGHKRSSEMLVQVARGFVERGERYLRQNDVAAAWNDLVAAEQVGVSDSIVTKLRQALTRDGIAEVRELLEAGEPARAAEVITQLHHRSVQQSELQALEEAAKAWALAREQADRGEFALALATVERVRKLLPKRIDALEQYVVGLEHRHQAFGMLIVHLHDAADHRDWREVVRLSEQVLAMAPHHMEARKARARAWRAIEPETIASAPHREEYAEEKAAKPTADQRFLLWIDGVGGYLVCLSNRVTLGQATPDAYVDIPLFADVSRMHAALTRDTEGYLLEATRPLLVNGRPAEKVLLQHGDRVTLGGSCQLQFQQPVPVSASARIDLASGHRLPLTVDGVLLMADTLVLGPGSQVHVSMPDLQQPIVLYRHKEGLGIRHGGNLSVDGQRCHERGLLGATSTVTGDDFAFAIEPVGTGMGRM